MVRAKLVKIGNSRGIRLAKPLLEVAGLSDEVEIEAAPEVGACKLDILNACHTIGPHVVRLLTCYQIPDVGFGNQRIGFQCAPDLLACRMLVDDLNDLILPYLMLERTNKWYRFNLLKPISRININPLAGVLHMIPAERRQTRQQFEQRLLRGIRQSQVL